MKRRIHLISDDFPEAEPTLPVPPVASIDHSPRLRRSARLNRSTENPSGADNRSSPLQQKPSLATPPSITKRKRTLDHDSSPNIKAAQSSCKRLRKSENINIEEKTNGGNNTAQQTEDNDQPLVDKNYINHWAHNQSWPREFFQVETMERLLARKKSGSSLRRKRSDQSLVTTTNATDQYSRDQKSVLYTSQGYPTLLESLGASHMREHRSGIGDSSNSLCKRLLIETTALPGETLFADAYFTTTCRNLQNRNESRIIQDIARLLVPSAETLATLGAKEYEILTESVNEGWDNCISVTSARPQPDYAVGFGRGAFSDDQIVKLQPFTGTPAHLSYFMATYYMYFPFFTCEVKCGNTALEIADRQNAHSMTLSVRGLVELFRLADREQELHRRVLTFSVSHDHRNVRLYGYYPIIDAAKTKVEIFRHEIHVYDIIASGGKERWTTYQFTSAVYRYALTLIKDIRAVLDQLPHDIGINTSGGSRSQLESSGVSQRLEHQSLGDELAAVSREPDLQPITPEASTATTSPVPKGGKKKKRKP